MSDEIYTLGAWRVKDGKQNEFVEAWKALVTVGPVSRRPPSSRPDPTSSQWCRC